MIRFSIGGRREVDRPRHFAFRIAAAALWFATSVVSVGSTTFEASVVCAFRLVGINSQRSAPAVLVLATVSSVPEEEQAEVVTGLQALAEAVLGEHGDKLDRALFAENAKSAAASSTVPFLKGALLGLLAEIRVQTSEELAAHVSAFARALPETLIQAGAFLDGVFAVSRTSILIGADARIAAIDELLRAAETEAFLTMLPRVRHAFDRLHERQRLSLCDRVAERYGLKDGEKIAKLETSVAAAAHLASIDARVAAIMKDWTF